MLHIVNFIIIRIIILCLLITSMLMINNYYYRWGQLHFLYDYIFGVDTICFKFHNTCNYNIKTFAVAMGNIFSMYQTSEQELKRQVKDLVVTLQLEGQHKIENLLYN